MKALSRMTDRGLSTVEDFEAMHAEIWAEWARESNNQKSQWEFFVPFVMKLTDDAPRPATFSLLGTTFILDKWQATEGSIGTGNIDQAFAKDFLKVEQRPETCLSLTAEGAGSVQAWETVIPAFDLFRGLLEYVHGYGRRSMSIGGGSKSVRSIFPVPQWLLARNASGHLEVLRFDINKSPDGNVQTLVVQAFDQIAKNAAMFADSPSKGSTTALLTDAFRLYAQALDEPFRHSCLLGLWQMGETLTLSNRFNGDTKMVCARLVATVEKRMQPPPTGLPKILEDIADKRNRIVHHGIHDVDDEDINILKLICEMALWCVMHAVDKLPTKEHLNHFLTLSCRAKTDLEVMGEALEWVYELERKLSTAKPSESP
jgi:hypothetical protein